MDKKGKGGKAVHEYRKYGEKVEFVLNNMTEEQLAALDDHKLDPPVLFQMTDKALELGFVVSIKYDGYSHCWQASLVCNAKAVLNTGLAVSGRSNVGGSDALFVACYKLFFLADGDLTQIAPSGNKFKRG
jgi:hypothetical protein